MESSKTLTILTDDAQKSLPLSGPDSLAAPERPITFEPKLPPRLRGAGESKAAIFATKQKWSGTVTRVLPGEFVAQVFDLTNPLNSPEEVTFDVRTTAHHAATASTEWFFSPKQLSS